MKDKILLKMTEIVGQIIRHYKTDFTEHDLITYGRMYENTPFIWVVRKCGTYITGIPCLYNGNDEEIKNNMTRFSRAIISHYVYEGSDKDNHFFLVYKGKSIKEIKGRKALELMNSN